MESLRLLNEFFKRRYATPDADANVNRGLKATATIGRRSEATLGRDSNPHYEVAPTDH
jgi:hypothetical protein